MPAPVATNDGGAETPTLPSHVYVVHSGSYRVSIHGTLDSAMRSRPEVKWRGCAYTDDGDGIFLVSLDRADFWASSTGEIEITKNEVTDMPVPVALPGGGTDTMTVAEVIAVLQQFPRNTPVTTFLGDEEVPLTLRRVNLVEPVIHNRRGVRLQIG